MLDDARTTAGRRRRRTTSPQITVDRVRKTIRVGSTVVRPEEIVTALADIAGDRAREIADDERRQVPIYVTADEHHALRQRAARVNLSMTELLRQALRATGVLEPAE